jgi:hypothetical protein
VQAARTIPGTAGAGFCAVRARVQPVLEPGRLPGQDPAGQQAGGPPPLHALPQAPLSGQTCGRKHCCGSMRILVWIRIRIRGSMPLTNGSGSFYFLIDLQDANKKLILKKVFLHITF